MSKNYWYMAVSNDKYELPYFVGESYRELEEWVRASGDKTSHKTLRNAPTGILETDNHKFKVMRVNRNTGRVLVGKLPKKKK